ncbi:hypothetical protein, partial [Staphylococcus pseudintermedius]|uniref:hypothetical protein n=1 Tax=Staphylococcus pseudintermedius TaxID=283734 RepID=UPI0028841392
LPGPSLHPIRDAVLTRKPTSLSIGHRFKSLFFNIISRHNSLRRSKSRHFAQTLSRGSVNQRAKTRTVG